MTESKDPQVTIRLRIGDTEFEVTGPSTYVEKKIAEFKKEKISPSINVGTTRTEQGVQSDPNPTKKGVSLSQFLKQMEFKTETDLVLLSGFFLERHYGFERFSASELREEILKAKQKPPKNISDTINGNIKKGFMMPSGNKENKMAFVLTTDGEEVVEGMKKPA